MKTFDIRNSRLIGPIAVILVLGLLYWLDNIQIIWRRQAVQTFTMRSFFNFSGVILILFATLIIFLHGFCLYFLVHRGLHISSVC